MIGTIVLILGLAVVVSFATVWIFMIPFVIASIKKHTERSADECEKIRRTLNNIEKELEQISESIKK